MPYRKATLRRGPLTGTTQTHLLVGRCLIGFSCQVCSGPHGQSHAAGLEPHTLNDNARPLWEKHKSKLLAIWRDPEGPQGGSGFNCEGLRGAGRLGLPTWAEIEFEGAKLPKYDKTWPSDIKEAFKELREKF